MQIVVGVDEAICTLGPLLIDQDGTWWASTAGHCVPDSPPDKNYPTVGGDTWSELSGPAVTDSTGRRFGTVIAALRGRVDGVGRDFALIALTSNTNAHPTMLGWDVTQSGDNSDAQIGTRLLLHGYGMVVSDVSKARDGYVTDDRRSWTLATTLPAAPGDSGAAVFDEAGGVVGVLSSAGGQQFGGADIVGGLGYSNVNRLAPSLELLSIMLPDVVLKPAA